MSVVTWYILVLSACHCLSVVLVIDHGNLRADEQETG